MTTTDGRTPASLRLSVKMHNSTEQARLPLPILLYLFATVLPLGFWIGPLSVTTLRLLLMVMILPLTARLMMGHFGRMMVTDVLFIAHLLWMAVALAVRTPSHVVEQTGSVGIEFLGGYLLGRAYVRTPKQFESLCRAVVLIVCCTLPFAVFEALTGRPIVAELLNALPIVSSVANVSTDPRMGLDRVQLTFSHPIHYGLFCSVALSLAFVALKDVTSGTGRWLVSGIILCCGFLSLSSGAVLAMALQLALIAWNSVFARLRARWWLLVGIFALAYVIVDLLSNRTPMKVFMTYATFSPETAYMRAIINEFGIANVWANPIFGLGLGDWVRLEWMRSSSVDNFWLLTAMRYGIPGFLFLALGYALGLIRVMRREFHERSVLARFRRAWVFTFLGLSFTLYTVHVWANIYSFVFLMYGAGMWMVNYRHEDSLEALQLEQSLKANNSAAVARSSYSRFPYRQR